MTGTIFDLVEEDLPEGQEGYLELAKRAPEPKDNSFLNSVKDYGKTALKGFVEGASQLGRIMGPTGGGLTPEQQTENLNKLLPTDENFGQRALRRGLKELPTATSFPGSTLATAPRALGAGLLGESAKDLGLPEWAQTAAELTSYIGPDVTKKLLEKGSNKEIIAWGKKMGMTDEAITPLIQPEFKQKWLAKISPRRGATEKVLGQSKSELSKVYSSIQESLAAKKVISTSASNKLMEEIDEKMFKMPASVREKVSTDFKDLLNNPISGETLINFYADINHEMGKNSKQLALLKEPIKNALREVEPALADDFDMINKLHSKYYGIAKKLEPNQKTDITEALFSASEALGTMSAIVFGNFPAIATFATTKVARKMGQQLLTNPRFQQISEKMILALNQNKYEMAKKLNDLLTYEVRKTSPELAEKFEKLSVEDFKKLSQKEVGKE